jgi:hypothetical protein
MKRIAGLLLGLFLLSGCARSQVYTLFSDKTLVQLEGLTIFVGYENHTWTALFVDYPSVTSPPVPVLKKVQVQAIEQVSGCKVDAAEFVTYGYLEATVVCPPNQTQVNTHDSRPLPR